MTRTLSRRGLLAASVAAGAMRLSNRTGQAEAWPVRVVPAEALPPAFRRQIVASPYPAERAAVVVDTDSRHLYLDLGDGRAVRYGAAVGREAHAWSGVAEVGRKVKWPAWTPTGRMLESQPGLSYTIDGGPGNPLGARALYLFQDGRDTLYRLHGGCDPRLLGRAVSSGCIRLLDQDIVDLYDRVALGARVVVR